MKLFVCSTSRSEAIQLQDMKRLTSRYVVEVYFLGCQKKPEKAPRCFSKHQGSTGLVVLCLPQERRNNDGIIDGLSPENEWIPKGFLMMYECDLKGY
jgi:hypothetical protein